MLIRHKCTSYLAANLAQISSVKVEKLHKAPKWKKKNSCKRPPVTVFTALKRVVNLCCIPFMSSDLISRPNITVLTALYNMFTNFLFANRWLCHYMIWYLNNNAVFKYMYHNLWTVQVVSWGIQLLLNRQEHLVFMCKEISFMTHSMELWFSEFNFYLSQSSNKCLKGQMIN